MLNHYRQKGWVVKESFIDKDNVIRILYFLKSVSTANETKMSSVLRKPLWKFYTSKWMFDEISKLLDTKTPWLFKDVDVKLESKDNFKIDLRTINEDSNDSTTVSCIMVLKDIKQTRGQLYFKNKDNGRWSAPKLRKGDVIFVDGDTEFESDYNLSEDGTEKRFYICSYSKTKIKYKKYYQRRFYDERKESETNAEGWYLEKKRQEKLSGDESPE